MNEEELVEIDIPDSATIGNGQIVIFDLPTFLEKTNALGIQVTDEGSIYLITDKVQLKEIVIEGTSRPRPVRY